MSEPSFSSPPPLSASAPSHEVGDAPRILIERPQKRLDMMTVLGLGLGLLLISLAIWLGHSKANFFNLPSVLMVVFGTMAVTAVSYSADEISRTKDVIGHALFHAARSPSLMARQILDLAVVARKRGILSLNSAYSELQHDPLLERAVQLVTDGYSGDDIERLLGREIDSLVDRHRRAASILRRAADISPAMGLIGTLVGLVQMLAELNNPDNIGPAMALALLTTFYGAIMGTVILSPLAAKLERNSNDEAQIRTLILMGASSIARQENPRRLELALNTELPAYDQVSYFD